MHDNYFLYSQKPIFRSKTDIENCGKSKYLSRAEIHKITSVFIYHDDTVYKISKLFKVCTERLFGGNGADSANE